jgi:hypothetical protein
LTKKVYERRFRDLKQTELNGLLRRAKQKKYGFEDVWFEVIEEVVKNITKLSIESLQSPLIML